MRLIDADILFENVGRIKPRNKEHYKSIGEFMNLITNTPTTNIKWIPVSERMPEPSSELLLVSGYIKTGNLKTFATDIARWNGDNWTFEGKPMPDVPILAWMPLPEPYREEVSDGNTD